MERFYAGVSDDQVLRPLYPEKDLGPPNVSLRDRGAAGGPANKFLNRSVLRRHRGYLAIHGRRSRQGNSDSKPPQRHWHCQQGGVEGDAPRTQV